MDEKEKVKAEMRGFENSDTDRHRYKLIHIESRFVYMQDRWTDKQANTETDNKETKT